MVPSSPYVPCKTGKTASRGSARAPSVSNLMRPLRDGSPTIATSSRDDPNRPVESKRCVVEGSNSAAAAGANQFPSLVIALGTISYLDISMAEITEGAEHTYT